MGLLTAGELAVDFQPHFVQCAPKLFGRLQKPLMSNRLSLIQGVEPSQETPDLIGNALLNIFEIFGNALLHIFEKCLRSLVQAFNKDIWYAPTSWVSSITLGELGEVVLTCLSIVM